MRTNSTVWLNGMSPRRNSLPASSFGKLDIDFGAVKPTRDLLLTSITREEEIENEIESQLGYYVNII